MDKLAFPQTQETDPPQDQRYYEWAVKGSVVP